MSGRGATAGAFAAVLQAARLETHAEKLKVEGYSEVADLMADIGLKKPELRRLRTALTAAGGRAGPAGGAAGVAAGGDTVLLPDGCRLEVCRAWPTQSKGGLSVGGVRAHGFFGGGHIPSRREACVAAPVQPPAMITLASFWQVSAVVIGRGGGGVVQRGRLSPADRGGGETARDGGGGGRTGGVLEGGAEERRHRQCELPWRRQDDRVGPDGRAGRPGLPGEHAALPDMTEWLVPSPPLRACKSVPLLPRLLLLPVPCPSCKIGGQLKTTARRMPQVMQLHRANLGSRLAQPPPLTAAEALGYLQQVHTPQQCFCASLTCDLYRRRPSARLQCRIGHAGASVAGLAARGRVCGARPEAGQPAL